MKKLIVGLILSFTFLSVGCTAIQSVSDVDTIPAEQPALEPEEEKKEDVVSVEPEEPVVEEEMVKEIEEVKEETKEETVLEEIAIELPQITEKEISSLSNETKGWSWKRNAEHVPPIAYADTEMLSSYDAYYLGNTDEKVIYLTFDNGYENGYTEMILDTLAVYDVKATFFCNSTLH